MDDKNAKKGDTNYKIIIETDLILSDQDCSDIEIVTVTSRVFLEDAFFNRGRFKIENDT